MSDCECCKQDALAVLAGNALPSRNGLSADEHEFFAQEVSFSNAALVPPDGRLGWHLCGLVPVVRAAPMSIQRPDGSYYPTTVTDGALVALWARRK